LNLTASGSIGSNSIHVLSWCTPKAHLLADGRDNPARRDYRRVMIMRHRGRSGLLEVIKPLVAGEADIFQPLIETSDRPFLRAARCRCESARQRSHHRTGRSTSLAHRVPPPSTRRGARCAAGGIRGCLRLGARSDLVCPAGLPGETTIEGAPSPVPGRTAVRFSAES
jgi:hypothetical protein